MAFIISQNLKAHLYIYAANIQIEQGLRNTFNDLNNDIPLIFFNWNANSCFSFFESESFFFFALFPFLFSYFFYYAMYTRF